MSKSVAIFLPPMQNISGGLTVIVQLGHYIAQAGYDVCFVIREYDTPYPTYEHLEQVFLAYEGITEQKGVPIVHWSDITLTPEYIWIVPEGWSNALALGLKAGARCIVYMQNWAFALRTLPNNTRWEQLPVEFLHISEPVRWCLEKITGKDGPILRPAIDTSIFYPGYAKASRTADLEKPVKKCIRIAWMPRKNKVCGEQIQDALTQRLMRTCPNIRVEWVTIHRLSHEDVAAILRTCHIFLSTGFPEGFALPPLEAMASGCLVVGFAGLGGWDYMRQISLPKPSLCGNDISFLAKPICPLRPVPFEGNGLYVADADVLSACLALEQTCVLLNEGGPELARVRKNIAQTAQAYSLEALKKNLQKLLPFFAL